MQHNTTGLVLLMGISSAYRIALSDKAARFAVWVMPGACTLYVNELEYCRWANEDSHVQRNMTLADVEHYFSHFETSGLNLYVQGVI